MVQILILFVSPIALLGRSSFAFAAEVDVEMSLPPGEIGEERFPQTIFVLAQKQGCGFILKCTIQYRGRLSPFRGFPRY
jgi:hypothetical protein